MRSERAIKNLITSVLQELTAIACGLLLPRLVNKLFDPKIFCKFVEISKFRDDGANRFIFRFSLIF